MISSSTIHFRLVTPARVLVEREVYGVTMQTAQGQITVLPHHAPLVGILMHGELLIHEDEKTKTPLAVAGGVLEISSDNTLTILADSAEHASEIDLAATQKRAEELAKTIETEKELDITSYNLLLRELERERARMHVAEKWRK